MRIRALIILFCILPMVTAAKSFDIRGVLPWHNFLCGPSTWNEKDYETYLDHCKEGGINFIGFHNYTGGSERYATYVEPMIQISYNNIVPQAFLDNSMSCRWGNLPLKLSDFSFGSASAIEASRGTDVFGSDASVKSNTPEEHYQNTQQLMQRVLTMAHDREIRMAMGFEFGVVPPEYFSLNASGDSFYWLGRASMIPNPCHSISAGLHYAAIDNLLDTYPEIDYVWLWLNEHSFFGIDVEQALENQTFATVYEEKKEYFSNAATDEERFIGIWSLKYIEMTLKRLKERGSDAKLIIGGWGGGNQLPSILSGLDKALPSEVIFSCLNPGLGTQAQPLFLGEIAQNRDVWALPWLEGDHQLWHYQPRVNLMKEHVQLAEKQKLKGVVAIHWRTEETKYNFKAFASFATNPKGNKSVQDLYTDYYTEDFGLLAAKKLAPIMAQADIEQLQASVSSPEYFSFTPEWGKLDEKNVAFRRTLLDVVEEVLLQTSNCKQVENLKNFKAMYEFELLLDCVVRAMIPAWQLRQSVFEQGANPSFIDYKTALKQLEAAPMEQMICTYASKVRSRGEMGVLSSINQRLWGTYLSLKEYLTSKISSKNTLK